MNFQYLQNKYLHYTYLINRLKKRRPFTVQHDIISDIQFIVAYFYDYQHALNEKEMRRKIKLQRRLLKIFPSALLSNSIWQK